MLNACAPGVAVVNIDNGYGAAVVAHRIAGRHRAREANEEGVESTARGDRAVGSEPPRR
jgi:hypothetical protein